MLLIYKVWSLFNRHIKFLIVNVASWKKQYMKSCTLTIYTAIQYYAFVLLVISCSTIMWYSILNDAGGKENILSISYSDYRPYFRENKTPDTSRCWPVNDQAVTLLLRL